MNLRHKIKHEVGRFQTLTPQARRMFLSSFLYEVASPIAFVFTNAYLFRTGESNALVALYNLGMFLGLPFGFYLNGFLLRRFQFRHLFAIGVPLQGLAGLILFFLPVVSPLAVLLFGCFFGFSMALYWANRNYLTLAATTDEHRTYYGGLEQVMAIYVGIVVPLCMGFFLGTAGMYRVFAILSLVIHCVNAGVLLTLPETKNPETKKVFLWQSSRQWLKVRGLEILLGIENGLEIFVPSLIILTFLGGVSTLGILTAAAAAIGSLLVYGVSSRVKPSERPSRLLLFTLVKIGLAALYACFFSKEAALILILLSPSLLQLKWPLQQSQVSKTLEEEEGGDDTNNYAYIADEELFLNIGRVVGVGLFFLVALDVSQTLTLRVLPFLYSVSQLGVAYIVMNLARHSYEGKYEN